MSRLQAANFVFPHPKGPIYGWFSQKGLQILELPTPNQRRLSVLHSFVNDHRVWKLHEALEKYFAGIRENFDGIPLDMSLGTPFQQLVWCAARTVLWGTISSYKDLAEKIGKPTATRAVGKALAANPLPIVVPCHRFILATGDLGGFSAGLEWKKELLTVENSWSQVFQNCDKNAINSDASAVKIDQ